MPIVQADRLRNIAAQLLIGAGASEQEAAIVSAHSVGANLAGHDSHGIIQIPTYIDRVKRGHIAPGAPFDIIRETSTNHRHRRQLGFRLCGVRTRYEHHHRQGKRTRRRRRDRVPPKPRRTRRRLPPYGGECRYDWRYDRRLRPLRQGRCAFRRARTPARHKPHLHRYAKRP